MADFKEQFTLKRFKADTLICEYMTADRFEDCFNYMLVMEDTESFQYYQITEERVYPDGEVKEISKSYFTKTCGEDIEEIYF